MSYKSYNNIKIKRRKDGRYYATKQVNNRREFVYGKTQEEVYNKIKELFPKQIKKPTQPTTFYEFWNRWIEKYKKPNVKARTLKNYENVFENQIKPFFEDRNIKNITPADLNILINNTTSGRMKEFLSQYLRECFKFAYRENKIKFDFWEEIKTYHHKRKEGNALSEEQRKILLQNLKYIKHGDIFKFYLLTGARPSEGRDFAPQDIEKNFIRIRGTKTETSDRYLPMSKQLKELLSKQDMSHKTVFNVSEATVKRERLLLIKLCKFKFLTKDLRTTFATMCAESGIAENVIAKWMGHTSTRTTKQYYIKVLNKFEKSQLTSLENTFDNTLDNTSSDNLAILKIFNPYIVYKNLNPTKYSMNLTKFFQLRPVNR